MILGDHVVHGELGKGVELFDRVLILRLVVDAQILLAFYQIAILHCGAPDVDVHGVRIVDGHADLSARPLA